MGAAGSLSLLPGKGAGAPVRRAAEQGVLGAAGPARSARRRSVRRVRGRASGRGPATARGGLAGRPHREGGGPRPSLPAQRLGRESSDPSDSVPGPLLRFPRGGATPQRPGGGRPSAGAAERAARARRAARRSRGRYPAWRGAVPASGPSVPGAYNRHADLLGAGGRPAHRLGAACGDRHRRKSRSGATK